MQHVTGLEGDVFARRHCSQETYTKEYGTFWHGAVWLHQLYFEPSSIKMGSHKVTHNSLNAWDFAAFKSICF